MSNGRRASNGRSSVYRGNDGSWHGRVTMGVRDDGTPDRRHVRGRTESEVTRKVQQLERQRDKGNAANPGRPPTVELWMTTYLETVAARTLAPRSLDDYWSKTRNWIIPKIGQHRLDRLQPEHLDRLYASMAGAGKAPSHIVKVHRIISRALEIAVRRGKVGRNVAKLVDPPPVSSSEVQPLSGDEARAILAAAEQMRNGARWSVGLALGLRQGEALGLRWQYVDLDQGTVRIWWQLQRQKGRGLVLREPKGRSHRVVPLPAQLVRSLRAHRKSQLAERLACGTSWSENDLVFCQPDGKPIDPRRDWAEWKALLAVAGVRDARVHDARHTAGTLLIEQGVHPRVVMEILGHSDLRLTQRYTHASSAMAADAAERMNRALWGTK
jgi:integrase